MSKKTPKTEIATNMEAAAAIFKFDVDVIKLAKANGAPGFRANGTIRLGELKKWLTEHPEIYEEAAAGIDITFERALWVRAKRKLEEQKHAERAKLLVPVEQLRRSWTRQIIAAKSKLYAAENSVAVEAGTKLGLSNEQVNAIKEIHMRHNRAAIKELFQGDWGKTACPHCRKEILPDASSSPASSNSVQ